MGVWGVVIFVLSVMRVVGSVPLWVECVFRRVDVVCVCLLYTQLLCTVSCMPHIGSSILQTDQECSGFYTPLVYVSSMSHVWLQQTSHSSVE